MPDQRTQFDETEVLYDGPWRHRFVDANGSRFHVAEMGTGPLILLLHGYPGFWWTWHKQIAELADAGFRVAAMDLRGYGASDKPPRGYDAYTMSADIAGLIRALGEREAVLVGHDLGGLLAWATASFHPQLVRRLVILSAAHPLRLRAALAVDPRGQLAASKHIVRFQLPRYEHVVTKDNARMIGQFLRRWAGPKWVGTADFVEYSRRCRTAMQIPQVSFCALEAYRWVFRTGLKLAGRRFVRIMQEPIVVPTLQLHGAFDTCTLPRTAQGSGRYVTARYEWRLLEDVGHFPHLEAPEVVTGEILRWIKEG